MTDLAHYLYVSGAPFLLTRTEIDEILAISHRNNAAAGITGLLLYGDGTFLQHIEGPEAALEATMARIARDTRHGGVTFISRGAARDRLFASWSMGFKRRDEVEFAPAHLGWKVGDAPMPETFPEFARALMRRVAGAVASRN